MSECCLCSQSGLCFNRKYAPQDYIEGKRSSLIWIVGLNPKGKLGENDTLGITELESYFEADIHPYFNDFRKVSSKLFELLGKDNGVAHTDIVKCFADKFPPKDCKGKDGKDIVNNCKQYFEKQLQDIRPKLIICNGRPVCEVAKDIIKPIEEAETYYRGRYDCNDITVVLSGFIGRIDDYAKRRLGLEIECHIDKLGII